MRWLSHTIVGALLVLTGSWQPLTSTIQDQPPQAKTPQEKPQQDKSLPVLDAGTQDGTDLHWSMESKLTLMNQLLDALVHHDAKAISQHAERISILTLDESWRVIQTQEYLQSSQQLRRITNRLAELGRQEDWHGIQLYYLSTVQQCMECHSDLYEKRLGTDR